MAKIDNKNLIKINEDKIKNSMENVESDGVFDAAAIKTFIIDSEKEKQEQLRKKQLKREATDIKLSKDANLIEIKDLCLHFPIGNKFNPKYKSIIRNTTITIKEREILGIIGESGSGKSVLTSTLTGLNTSSQIISQGHVKVGGIDVTDFDERDWQLSKLRGRFISQIFQNPLGTLNPTKKVGAQIIEAMVLNSTIENKGQGFEKAVELLRKVKINDPVEVMGMYPHQLSGGMRQRVVIVTIIACNPKVIIFDEPTTALDPSVQKEIIEMIKQIRNDFNVAIIFITHDIGLVSTIADRIAIMYAGKIIEEGMTEEILFKSEHPYTWGLLRSMPEIAHGEKLYSIPGSVPGNLTRVKGDSFSPRNEFALEIDDILSPPRFDITKTHFVHSWLHDKKAPKIKKPDLILKLEKDYKKFSKGGKK